jgi:hypothetical protein
MEELQIYVRGAVNYYEPGITYREALELESWLRTRVRHYYWNATVRSTGNIAKGKPQSPAKRINSGGAAQRAPRSGKPRTRRRNLLRLGIAREKVHMASRSRKGLPPVGRPSGCRWQAICLLCNPATFGFAPLGSVSERPCKGSLSGAMTDGNRPVQPSAARQTVMAPLPAGSQCKNGSRAMQSRKDLSTRSWIELACRSVGTPVMG